jgi:hypothetical protein
MPSLGSGRRDLVLLLYELPAGDAAARRAVAGRRNQGTRGAFGRAPAVAVAAPVGVLDRQPTTGSTRSR